MNEEEERERIEYEVVGVPHVVIHCEECKLSFEVFPNPEVEGFPETEGKVVNLVQTALAGQDFDFQCPNCKKMYVAGRPMIETLPKNRHERRRSKILH